MAKQQVSFTLNGQQVDVLVEPRDLLIYVIREQLKQTGAHIGCETSHCGACTVDINGQSVKSCTFLAVQADGAEVVTVEGLAANGDLHPVQEGFMQEHGLQCGYCTPGMQMRAYRLLQENPYPSEERSVPAYRATYVVVPDIRILSKQFNTLLKNYKKLHRGHLTWQQQQNN